MPAYLVPAVTNNPTRHACAYKCESISETASEMCADEIWSNVFRVSTSAFIQMNIGKCHWVQFLTLAVMMKKYICL